MSTEASTSDKLATGDVRLKLEISLRPALSAAELRELATQAAASGQTLHERMTDVLRDAARKTLQAAA